MKAPRVGCLLYTSGRESSSLPERSAHSGGGYGNTSVFQARYVYVKPVSTEKPRASPLRTEKPKDNGCLWSKGIQYNINPTLGAFIEPGAAFYFKDGSFKNTIRDEYPFHFNPVSYTHLILLAKI